MVNFQASSHARLGEAISNLGGTGFLSAFAAWLRQTLRHDNITILAYFQGRAPVNLLVESALPDAISNVDKIYVAGAYLLDPFHDLHISRAPRGVYRLNEIAPDQFHRNPYFLDYYASTTMVDELAFITYPADGVSVHVCLGRDANSNTRFSARDVAHANTISPIVEALSESHWSGLDAPGEYSEAEVTTRLIDSLRAAQGVSLSPRQAEVALLILRGHSSVSIGLRLGISAQTVKVFRRQLYKKCAISSQAELFTLLLPLLG